MKRGRPQVIQVIGPPGCGKGTQCERLLARCDSLTYFSVGELLREEVVRGTALGQVVKPILDAGGIVPADVAMSVMKSRIHGSQSEYIVIDGFPRTVEQAEAFRKIVGAPFLTLNFTCSREDCMERLMNRSMSSASARSDDTGCIMDTRYNAYLAQTVPGVDYLRAQGCKVVDVDCSDAVDAVTERIFLALDQEGVRHGTK